jgi:hypothetical protein
VNTLNRKITIISLMLSAPWTIVGCQINQTQLFSGRNSLPPEVAGMWQAQDSPWKIVLNRNGTVSSAVIPMGQVEITPNKITRVEMKDGSFSTYKAGDCIVEYTPETRLLLVTIEMQDIHITFNENVIDGNSLDRFVGPVSEDGKTWTPDWIAVFDYGPRFPQEPNDILAQPLVFKKVDD